MLRPVGERSNPAGGSGHEQTHRSTPCQSRTRSACRWMSEEVTDLHRPLEGVGAGQAYHSGEQASRS
jgi:hypothetical protein